MTSKVAKLHFSIQGEFITDHCRSLVLEHRWHSAFNLLVEDLHGMTADWAFDILSGKRKLVGWDNDIHLENEDPTDPTLIKYLKDLDYILGGTYEDKGQFWRPSRQVVSWGYEDAMYAKEQGCKFFRDTYGDNETRIRSEFYAYDDEKVFIVHDKNHTKKVILFKPIGGVPPFVKSFKTPDESYNYFIEQGRWIETTGHTDVFGVRDEPEINLDEIATLTENVEAVLEERRIDEEEADEELREEKYKLDLERYRQQVTEQANANGGWFDLYVKEYNKTYQIPKAPFMHWMHSMWGLKDDFEKAGMTLIDWTPVCPSGMKMFGDNRYHTDWFICTGLDPMDAYGSWNKSKESGRKVNDAAYSYMYSVFHLHNRDRQTMPLVRNGKVTGKVVTPSPTDTVHPGDIMVIPTAGPEYDILTRIVHSNGGGAIITEVGGKLCHLATVGREGGYRMVMLPDALEDLKPGMTIEVDSDTGTIRYLDMPSKKR